MKLYSKIENIAGAPPGFRTAEKCCGNCINFYDESTVKTCMKYEWFVVNVYNLCDEFDSGFI